MKNILYVLLTATTIIGTIWLYKTNTEFRTSDTRQHTPGNGHIPSEEKEYTYHNKPSVIAGILNSRHSSLDSLPSEDINTKSLAASGTKQEAIDLETFHLPNDMKKLFRKTMVKSQEFILNNEKDTTIVGKEGTRFSILANSFTDKNGKPVKGNITFEVKEVYNKSDLVLSNLPTISKKGLLESDGVIYVNAEKEGKLLQLAEEKTIFTEMPTNNKQPGMQQFMPMYLYSEKMIWQEGEAEDPNLINLPFHLLAFDSTYHLEIEDSYVYGSKKLKRPEYQGTFIATREFEARYAQALNFTGKTDEILNIYFQNIDKSLYEADLKVYSFLSKVCKWDIHRQTNYWTNLRDAFKNFASFKSRKLINFNACTADLESAHALDQLMQNGLNEKEAGQYIQLYNIRKQLILERQKMAGSGELDSVIGWLRDSKISERRQEDFVKKREKYAFNIPRLGWINCDRFSRSDGPLVNGIIDLAGERGNANMVFIVFKNTKSCLRLFYVNGQYPYNSLPEKYEATAIAISLNTNTNEVFLGMKDIEIGELNAEEKAIHRLEMLKCNSSEDLELKIRDKLTPKVRSLRI